jgi:hypothetical protein
MNKLEKLQQLADKLGFAFHKEQRPGGMYKVVCLKTGEEPLGAGFCATLKDVERLFKSRNKQPRDALGRFAGFPTPSFSNSLSAAERATRDAREDQARLAMSNGSLTLQDIKKTPEYKRFVSHPDKSLQAYREKLTDRAILNGLDLLYNNSLEALIYRDCHRNL